MSENLKLGSIITDEQQRDAVHVAVAPATAAEKLTPGQHVSIIGSKAWASAGTPIGVVDPYLKADVRKGQRFWLFLYPGSIRSLRHEWTHPAFAADPVKATSEEWMQNLSERLGLPYDDLLAAGRSAAQGESGWVGDDSNSETMNNDGTLKREFFEHFEIITGISVSEDRRDNAYFSCAC